MRVCVCVCVCEYKSTTWRYTAMENAQNMKNCWTNWILIYLSYVASLHFLVILTFPVSKMDMYPN